jgi:hypothetical protein
LREAERVDPRRAHDLGVEGAAEEPALVDMRDGREQHRARDPRNWCDVHF